MSIKQLWSVRNHGLLTAACVASTAAFLSFVPSEAKAASYIRFDGTLGGPMNPGPVDETTASSTQFQCPAGGPGCVTEQTGIFASFNNYSPFVFNYTATPGTSTGTNEFTKPYTGTLGNFQILGGLSPISVVINSPATGIFQVNVDPVARNTFNNINPLQSVVATVQAGGQTYSNSTVVYTANAFFNWDGQTQPVYNSYLWVFVGDPDPSAAVPSPLPILGSSVAFGWARRLRKRVASA